MATPDLFADVPSAPKAAPSGGLFDDVPDAPSAADLIATGIKKFIPSAGNLIKNTVSSLNPANYPAEGRAISSLVRGGLENVRDISPPGEARGSAPPMATPQEQAAATAAGQAAVRPYIHPLKSFADDPAGTLASLSIPATLGGSALETAPAGALQTLGKFATTLGDATNPVGLAVKGAAAVPKLIARVAPKGMSAAQMAANQARFATAGVDSSAATVGGPLTQGAARVTAKGPLSIGARANIADQIGQVGDAVTDTASAYGNPTTPNLAGETLQGGIQRYVGDAATPGSFKAKVEGMYDNAFAPILKGENDAVTASEAAQAKRAGDLQGDYQQQLADARDAQAGEQLAAEQGIPIPDDQKTVLPTPPDIPDAKPTTSTTATQKTLGDIVDSINSPAIRSRIQDPRINGILNDLQNDPASVRFSDLRQLRTWVRNAQGDPDLILGVGKGNLQQLEGALTDDIYSNAQSFGGDAALRTLQRTDQYYKAGVQRIQNALQPFVDKASPEGAIARLQGVAGSGASADVNSLFRLKRSLQPDEFGDIQASLIQNAGQIPDGKGATTFSPTAFVNWYSKLPDASKDILFGAGGSAAKAKPAAAALKTQLDNLVSVASDVAPLEKTQGVVSGASPYQATGAVFGMLHPATFLPVLTTLTGEAGAAQLLTSPRALVWINRLSSAGAKGADAVAPVMAGLSRVAKTDAQLQPIYQAANSILNPPAPKGAGQAQAFDPSQMTDEELKGAGGAPAAPVAPVATAVPSDEGRVAMINSMTPQEAMALTIAGEASSDPHEMAGVGHVMANRLASGKYGSTLADVLKPEEFNVWENPTALAQLKGTPKYDKALTIAGDILAGKNADVTGHAEHYYAPKALAILHQTQPDKYPNATPSFAQGNGTPLGESVFYP